METFLHLRLELHKLGGTFNTAKLPGHAGVYPMAAADACAKACHALRPADVQLVVHSTLVIPHAIPNNPATVATGADPATWQKWAGRPSAHAAPSRHLRFARARLQEVGGQRLLQRYCAQHGGAAPYLAVDWVQAGLRPPPRETGVLWNAMLAHFNAGEHVHGAEDGTANSGTVASAVTGGGELHHGVQAMAPCRANDDAKG